MKVEKLQVSAKKFNSWVMQKQHGDIQAIHDSTGITKENIRKAFKYAEADQETADAIDAYFKTRNAKVIA